MIHLTLSFIFLIIGGISLLLDIDEATFVILELSMLNVFTYCIRDLRNRIVLLFFSISFFVLLVSRVVISKYFDVDSFSYHTEDVMYPQYLLDIYLQLVVAINSVFICFFLVTKNNRSDNLYYNYESIISRSIRKSAKFLSYFCFVFSLYAVYKRITGVLSGGYLALYMDTDELDIPFLVKLFAGKYEMCMCLFLATMPLKREARLPIILFFLNAFFSLFTGQRNSFVIPMLFIILYMFLRNEIPYRVETWLPRKVMMYGLVSTPFFFIFMYLVMVLRSGGVSDSDDLIGLFLGSIYQLGSSVQVIHDTIFLQDDLSKQNFYCLQPIIDFVVHNPFTDWFFDIPRYEPQTVDMALHGRELGSSITYLTQPERYLLGGSKGSSYVAETWIDFGYCGIVFFSCVYGYILGKVITFLKKNIFFSFISLYSMMQIIYAPRSLTLTFISRFIEVKSWPFFLIIWVVYLIAKDKTLKERNCQKK